MAFWRGQDVERCDTLLEKEMEHELLRGEDERGGATAYQGKRKKE